MCVFTANFALKFNFFGDVISCMTSHVTQYNFVVYVNNLSLFILSHNSVTYISEHNY